MFNIFTILWIVIDIIAQFFGNVALSHTFVERLLAHTSELRRGGLGLQHTACLITSKRLIVIAGLDIREWCSWWSEVSGVAGDAFGNAEVVDVSVN